MLTYTTEVSSPRERAFAYVTDPSRFGEWQRGGLGGCTYGDGPAAAGTRCVTVRRIGLGARRVVSEITHVDPPNTWRVRGVNGPIRATVDVTVEPIDEARRSRVTIGVDFAGHGVGRLLVPFGRRRGGRAAVSARKLRACPDPGREQQRPARRRTQPCPQVGPNGPVSRPVAGVRVNGCEPREPRGGRRRKACGVDAPRRARARGGRLT